MLTVGYGDMYPITHVGRAIAIIAGFGGLLLSAALITMVHKYLTLSPEERAVMDFMERHNTRRKVRSMAARCIQLMFKANKANKVGGVHQFMA